MTETMESNTWRKCSFCKKEIVFASTYYVCSVSTCNHKRTGLVFCSVSCCSGHSDMVRHRDGWALEEKAPTKEIFLQEQHSRTEKIMEKAPLEQNPSTVSVACAEGNSSTLADVDTLVVVSKVKQYIRDKSGFNTSASTMDALTERIVQICDAAILSAKTNNRKTVMDRDVPSIVIET